MPETVAVVGASHKTDRFSNKAMKLLIENSHKAIPVSPTARDVLEQTGKSRLTEIEEAVDTVTLYVGPARQTEVISDIIELRPKRVIFNPGTENSEAFEKLDAAGIDYLIDCTLILLNDGTF